MDNACNDLVFIRQQANTCSKEYQSGYKSYFNFFMRAQKLDINSLRPSDAYMRQQTNHHWFR